MEVSNPNASRWSLSQVGYSKLPRPGRALSASLPLAQFGNGIFVVQWHMLWVYHGIPVYLLQYVITISIYYITMWIWGPYNYGYVDVLCISWQWPKMQQAGLNAELSTHLQWQALCRDIVVNLDGDSPVAKTCKNGTKKRFHRMRCTAVIGKTWHSCVMHAALASACKKDVGIELRMPPPALLGNCGMWAEMMHQHHQHYLTIGGKSWR